MWLNSPVATRPVACCRRRTCARSSRGRASAGRVVASDECYAELRLDGEHRCRCCTPSVCGGSFEGLLAVHSLSKRSNLAGYRAGLVAGDAVWWGQLLEVRKHTGMLVPAPVQAAATAALSDDAHVAAQRETLRAPPGVAPRGGDVGRVARRPLRGRPLSVGDP